MLAARAALLLSALVPLLAQSPSADSLAFYESKVRPVLRANCLPCHNQEMKNSGLALDSRADVLAGGNRGAAVNLIAPSESVLLKAVEQTGDLKMPPGRKLSDEQIAVLREWVAQGVPLPPPAQAKKPRGWDHWAFQQPKRTPPPAVSNSRWVRNPIDRFILARLDQEKIAHSPEADRYTLLRRVSLDLTGIPPGAKEIADFLGDRSPQAYEKVVDRLLASPHYGERWGRHWLDLARYSDSDGYSIDDPRPIWKYRDWVIHALNRDQPFDQFVVEQIAGDLLPNATVEQLTATGFHRNTPSNYEGGIDFEQYRNEAVADRVATTGAVFLGLTVGCARCHDHKYDPVSQREFYQLFAYFNNTDEITTESERPEYGRPMLPLPTPDEQKQLDKYQADLAEANRELVMYVRTLAAKPSPAGDPPKHRDQGLTRLINRARMVRRRPPSVTSTLIMRELPEPRPAYIHLGGEFTRKGAPVEPGTPAVLGSVVKGGNRLDLAKWLVNPANPLTARVTVNRMWQAYFGKGLVETENDFGLVGSKPTYPELLDWLATEFVARGWSQKAMHRLIVTSAAYRQASKHRPDLEERDPYNTLLARQSRLRVEAEIARDVALTASGLLNPAVGGPSVFPPIPPGALAGTTQVRKPWPTSFGPDRYRRGMYTFSYRSALHPALGFFDVPDGTATCTRRVRSNSPLQSLTLLNDTAFVEFARGLARRIVAEVPQGDRSRIEHGFLLAVGRKPSSAETDRLARFLAVQRDEFHSDPKLATMLLGGGGPEQRSIQEAQEAANARPGGPQSPRGIAVNQGHLADAKVQLAAAKEDAVRKAAELGAMDPAAARELAAWTAVSRVLLNVDDFVTRN